MLLFSIWGARIVFAAGLVHDNRRRCCPDLPAGAGGNAARCYFGWDGKKARIFSGGCGAIADNSLNKQQKQQNGNGRDRRPDRRQTLGGGSSR